MYKRNALLFLLALIWEQNATAFFVSSPARPCNHKIMNALPTAAQVSNDDFMKQLGHASQIIPVLHPEDGSSMSEDESALLLDVLSKQFAHSDGIRGFFAVYLTSPESLTMEEVPTVLAEAVRGADTEVMVPLACMNVIMPTAMTTIHKDEELKECARKTAENGRKILRLLKEDGDVVSNCKAIYQVCNDEVEEGDELTEYWSKFFTNYKYETDQKAAISGVIEEFC